MTPKKFIPFPILLLCVNIIVFAAVGLQDGEMNGYQLLKAGGLFAPYSMGEQKLSLFMYMFLHSNVLHLFMNMLGLIVLGVYVERRVHSLPFLIIYLVCGLVAAFCSMYYIPFTLSVGASGAIFGLYGFYITDTFNKAGSDRSRLLAEVLLTLGLSVALSFFMPLDHAAHIGGFVTGVLLFYIIRAVPSGRFAFSRFPLYRINFVRLGLTFLIPVLLYMVFPRYPVEYLEYSRFADASEKRLNKFYAASYDTDHELHAELDSVINIPATALARLQQVSGETEQLLYDKELWEQYWQFRDKQLRYLKQEYVQEAMQYKDSVWIMRDSIQGMPPLQIFIDPLAAKESPEYDSARTAPVLNQVTLYYDADWKELPGSDNASYYRKGTVDSLGRWQEFVKDFYISGAIQMKGYYKDGLKEGTFFFYTEDSSYSEFGRFFQDDRIGKWEDYHDNGQLHHTYEIGVDYFYIVNAWDKWGEQLVDDGEGYELELHASGKIKNKIPVKAGVYDGPAEGYYPYGAIHFKEMYESGRLIRGYAVDTTGMMHRYDDSQWLPYPVGGMEQMDEYMIRENQYLSDTTDLISIVRFNVLADGTLTDFRVLVSATPAMDQEAIRLIKEGPAWAPAYRYGYIPISTEEEMVVRFKKPEY